MTQRLSRWGGRPGDRHRKLTARRSNANGAAGINVQQVAERHQPDLVPIMSNT